MKITAQHWINYMENFWGYGTLQNGGIWFLGLEEGGCRTVDLIHQKIKSYNVNPVYNGHPVVDNYRFQHLLYDQYDTDKTIVQNLKGNILKDVRVDEYISRWFDGYTTSFKRLSKNTYEWFNGFYCEPQELQRTWQGYITFLMTLTNKVTGKNIYSYTKEEYLFFQRDRLGRQLLVQDYPLYNHAMIEIMPLPSPSVSEWRYKDFKIPKSVRNDLDKHYNTTDLLKSRKTYNKVIGDIRRKKFMTLIDTHQPRTIIINGLKYERYFQKLFNNSLENFYDAKGNREYLSNKNTRATTTDPLIIMTQHSCQGRGRSKEYWKKIALIK